MSSAIVIDTETTGLDEPDVISLAYTAPLDAPSSIRTFVEATIIARQFRPRKPISLGAMATHHIIPADLEKEEPWPGTWSPPADVEYLIGHSVDFDWQAIGSPHITRICTLALARWVWPNIDAHSLTALLYFLWPHEDARSVVRGAHNTKHDVWLCAIVLERILHARPELTTWHEVWQASERARIPTHLGFGKYGPYSDWAKSNAQPKGLPIVELRRLDPGYLSWLLSGKCDQVNDDPYLQKALRGDAA